MGAGKQEAPPMAAAGGDGPEPPQPVVLRMELHCAGCAKKVRKSIHHMPGVVSVVADPAANTVVVAGTADAAALKARIESKTKKPVQIVSAGGAAPNSNPPPAGAEPKKASPNKQQGGGEEKRNPDKGGGGADKADKAGSSHPEVTKEGKKQPLEEKKPIQEMTPTPTPTTALLKIRLHCDSCADRIRRRICKIKGVKDVVVEGGGNKDEVKVVGTMDVPAMLAYLNDKLNRPVELAVAAVPGSKDAAKARGGGDDGHVKKDKGAGDGAHRAADKGKGVEVAGPSVASAAASVAAPAGASTHHVSPYGYGHVAYPQPPHQGPPPGYYGGGTNAEGGARYANAGGYYQQQPRGDAGGYYQQQPSSDAGGYYQQQPRGDAGGYYQQQPSSDAGGYYQQQPSSIAGGGGYYPEQRGGYYDQPSAGSYYPGGYEQQQHPANPPPYQQQPYSSAYGFDTAPPTQMFSDENPESCSIM